MKFLLSIVLVFGCAFTAHAQADTLQGEDYYQQEYDEQACLVQARDKKNNHIQTFVTDFNGLAGLVDAGAKCLAFMSKRKDPLCYCRIHQTICSPMTVPATWAQIMQEALGRGVSYLYEKYADQNCNKSFYQHD